MVWSGWFWWNCEKRTWEKKKSLNLIFGLEVNVNFLLNQVEIIKEQVKITRIIKQIIIRVWMVVGNVKCWNYNIWR